MKVFISWSGDYSRRLGAAIDWWLPRVLQSVDIFFSETDIEIGSSWYNEIIDALERTDAGLIILTPENVTRQWIMFEAGAIARGVSKDRVCPILFGIKKSDVRGPLAVRHSAEFTEDDFRKVQKTLNNGRLGDADLKEMFDTWWPKLEEKVKAAQSAAQLPSVPERSVPDLLEEVVENTRAILREFENLQPWQRFIPGEVYDAASQRRYGGLAGLGGLGGVGGGGGGGLGGLKPPARGILDLPDEPPPDGPPEKPE